MNIELILCLLLIIFIATFVRATFGFGDGLIGMPLLLMIISLKQAVVIANFYGLIIGLFLCLFDLKLIVHHWKEITIILLFSLIGTYGGFLVLNNYPEKLLILLLAVILLCYPLIYYFKSRLHYRIYHLQWAPVLGVFEGFLSVTINSNGPPLTIYGQFRGWRPEIFVAVMQPIFLIGNVINLGLYAKHNYIYFNDLLIALLAIPLMVLSVYLGKKIRVHLTTHKFEHVVVAIIFISGAASLYHVLS